MSKDLTNYEFEGLVSHITDLYKANDGLADTYDSATGQLLIQLLADVADNLHYKLERRSQENYTSTARLESSIRAAVSSIGYRPRRKVSSTGTVLVELLDSEGNPVVSQGNINFLHGTSIFFDGIEFVVDSDHTIVAGESSIDIKVKQGRYVSEVFNFNELPYSSQNYVEFSDSVNKEEHSIVISDDDGVYSDVLSGESGLRIRSMSFADSNTAVYDIKNTKAGMRIEFGDGIFGKKPKGNVKVSWVESDGGSVNIVKTGLSFKLDSSILTDDVPVNPPNRYTYTIENITPIRGGQDEESIEDMRHNVQSFLRTNDRAVTNFDYEFWTKRSGIGNISDVNVYGESETNILIFTMNNVYISYATADRLPLTVNQVQDLRNYLNNIKMNTTHLVFKPADFVYLGMDVKFKRHPSLPITDAQLYKIVRDNINSYFSIKTGSIGKEFQHSEFIEYLQNLKVTFNDIIYRITDFVSVSIEGVMPLLMPQDTYDSIIEINDYTVVANDVWSVIIDDIPYTVVATSLDTVESIIDKMQQKIFEGTSLMLAKPNPNQIRIKHPDFIGTYTISMGAGEISQYAGFKQLIKLPRSTNEHNQHVNQILPGSVKIVTSNGSVIMEDNGEGLLVSPDNTYPSVDIDYSMANFEYPAIPQGEYFVKFKQNNYQNYSVTRDSVLDVMPIREDMDSEVGYYFSTIDLLR